MQWAYAQSGVQIPRVTYTQIEAPNGIEVADRADLKPGDLMFFANAGDVHHVGMFLGGDKFLHAPHTGDVVKVSSLERALLRAAVRGRAALRRRRAASPPRPPPPRPVAAPRPPRRPPPRAGDRPDRGRQGPGRGRPRRRRGAPQRLRSSSWRSRPSRPSKETRDRALDDVPARRSTRRRSSGRPRPAAAAAAPPAAPAPVDARGRAPRRPPRRARRRGGPVAPAGAGGRRARRRRKPSAPSRSTSPTPPPTTRATTPARGAREVAGQAGREGRPAARAAGHGLARRVRRQEPQLRRRATPSASSRCALSIWNQGAYAGYPEKPELQAKWFIDQALARQAQARSPRATPNFGKDPAKFGEWIADVERPAEQYRGRYQLRLAEARKLLS